MENSSYEGGTKFKTQSNMSASPHKSKIFGTTATAVQNGFMMQKTRIQITSDWKDTCINQELAEIEKLEKFVSEERVRSHAVAQSLLTKQAELEKRRIDLIELKKLQQVELKQKNKENAAKAGFKAQEMMQGSMA